MKGPHQIDPNEHSSAVGIGLFVLQEDNDQEVYKRNPQMVPEKLSVFSSNYGLYPYNIYNIDEEDMDRETSSYLNLNMQSIFKDNRPSSLDSR